MTTKINNEFKQTTMASLTSAMKGETIKRMRVDSIEKIEVEEGRIEKCAISYYEDEVKVIIPLDEMDVYHYSPKNAEISDKEIQSSKRDALDRMLGASIPVVVKNVFEDRHRALASRKEALRRLRSFNTVSEGEIVEANVVEVTWNFAVLEFDGYIGTMAKKDAGHGVISDINDYVKVGDKKSVKIISKQENGTYFVSLKDASANPFDEYVIEKEFYTSKSRYVGTVKSVSEYGIFVELRQGITVLCQHPSTRMPNFVPIVGEKINIQITKINEEKKQLSGMVLYQ
ncbi:MAG: S1 RNA-binding domain-containing protein [Clostridium sp.]